MSKLTLNKNFSYNFFKEMRFIIQVLPILTNYHNFTIYIKKIQARL